MQRKIAAIPTMYNGVQFRSRLEARWAAFFDVNGWKWIYEPIDLAGWIPDFYLELPCSHSECNGSHRLYVEVKPYDTIAQFKENKTAVWRLYQSDAYSEPHPAMFGLSPECTHWQMAHGAGGGCYDIQWQTSEKTCDAAWKKAGNLVQWRGVASVQ